MLHPTAQIQPSRLLWVIALHNRIATILQWTSWSFLSFLKFSSPVFTNSCSNVQTLVQRLNFLKSSSYCFSVIVTINLMPTWLTLKTNLMLFATQCTNTARLAKRSFLAVLLLWRLLLRGLPSTVSLMTFVRANLAKTKIVLPFSQGWTLR